MNLNSKSNNTLNGGRCVLKLNHVLDINQKSSTRRAEVNVLGNSHLIG